MSEPANPRLQAFGSHLRRLREDRGLSLEALAEAAGLSRRGLVYLEHGQRDPRYTTLLALAAGLSVPVSRLVDVPR